MNKTILTKCVTLLALISLIYGCGLTSVDDVASLRDSEKELIHNTVTDKDRAERLLKLIEQQNLLEDELSKLIHRHQARMKTLNADYSAERESFVQAIKDFDNERMQKQNQFIKLVEAMRTETTAEEWQVIAKYQLKNLSPHDVALQQNKG